MSASCLVIAELDASISSFRGKVRSASRAASNMSSIVVGLAWVTCMEIYGFKPLITAKRRMLSSADINFASFLICMM